MKSPYLLYFIPLFFSIFSSSRGRENGTTINSEEQDLVVNCSLCADPSHTPWDPFSIFVAGEATMSCQTAYDLGPLRLPQLNCTFWQKRGSTVCQCAAERPEQNTCTLCEDGQSLPDPFLEGRPGLVCALLQIQAKRDDPENCIVWQQTQGVYCGCENPTVTSDKYEVCRLCGNDHPELMDPMAVVLKSDGEVSDRNFSCGEAEFQANLPENRVNCKEYMAHYGEHCCRELPPVAVPSESPTGETGNGDEDVSASRHQVGSRVSRFAFIAASVLSIVYLM